MNKEEMQNELADIIIECANTLEAIVRNEVSTPSITTTKSIVIGLISAASEIHDGVSSQESLSEEQMLGSEAIIKHLKESLMYCRESIEENTDQSTQNQVNHT